MMFWYLVFVLTGLAHCMAKPVIQLGVCTTYSTPGWETARHYHHAAKVAMEEGFFDDQVQSTNFTLDLVYIDGGCNAMAAAEKGPALVYGRGQTAGRIHSDVYDYPPVAGIIGCFCSASSKTLALLARPFGIMLLGFAASDPELSNKVLYPNFARLSSPSTGLASAWGAVVAAFGWRYIVAITTDQEWAQNYLAACRLAWSMLNPPCQVVNIDIERNSVVNEQSESTRMETWDAARQVQALDPQPRVLFHITNSGPQSSNLWRAIDEIGFLGDPFLNLAGWMTELGLPRPGGGCCQPTESAGNGTDEDVYDWEALYLKLHGTLTVIGYLPWPGPLGHSAKWSMFYQGLTREKLVAAGMPPEFNTSILGTPSDLLNVSYGLLFFDGTVAYISAIGQLLASGVPAEDIKGQTLQDAIFRAQFEGLTGKVSFTEEGDRIQSYLVTNWQISTSETAFQKYDRTIVGVYSASSGLNAVPEDFEVTLAPYSRNRKSQLINLPNGVTCSLAAGVAQSCLHAFPDQAIPCQSGYEYHSNQRKCTLCEWGRYSPASGSKCFDCEAGRHSSASRTTCDQCSWGFLEPNTPDDPCRMDPTIIVLVVGLAVGLATGLVLYRNWARLSHIVRFRNLQKRMPVLLQPSTKCELLHSDQGHQAFRIIPPGEYPVALSINRAFGVYQDQLRFVGRWTTKEMDDVMGLSEALLQFFALLITAIKTAPDSYQKSMLGSYLQKKRKYWGVYNSVLRGVIIQDGSWSLYAPLTEQVEALVVGLRGGTHVPSRGAVGCDTAVFAERCLMAHRGLQPSLTEDPRSLIALMQHSLGSQAWLRSLCHEIASACGCTTGGAKQKGLYRVIEKFALEKRGLSAPVNRCRDAAREMIVCTDVRTICSVLRSFMERMQAEELLIVSFKDRFQHPTDGGWADCLLCVVRLADPHFHIAEVQVVHSDMMAVRHNMGAHHEYNEFRAIAEIFEGLNWSLSDTDLVDAATEKQEQEPKDIAVAVNVVSPGMRQKIPYQTQIAMES